MAFECRGRRMLVEFACGRCGKVHIEPYATQHNDAEGNLQCYKPPAGWLNAGLYNPMLCADCNAEYKSFLRGGKVNA